MKYKDYESTDCITFVLNVLKETYMRQKNDQISKALTTYGMTDRGKGRLFYGDVFVKKMIKLHNWSSIYLSPDKFHPTDGDKEHPHTTYLAMRFCKYHDIPVHHIAIDYKPLAKDHENFQELFPKAGVRKVNKVSLEGLMKIPFGIGLSRGGNHTWLFSKGKVYEAHWEYAGIKLYEATDIRNWAWQSNLIIVPPDAQAHIKLAECK